MKTGAPRSRRPSVTHEWNHGRQGILVDHEILRARREGLIRIEPFSGELVEPATYDLRVGERAVISTTSRAIDLGHTPLLVIEPGAMAILQSLETIELSKRVAARVGPKTSLLRRGVFVSVGPQIDPGYKGRLIVNLINLSPRPFALHYQDRFLSAEFHLLAAEPTKGYEGPYQGRTELLPEDLELLLAYQGPTLADLHRGFAEIRDNIREVAALGKEIPKLVEIQERGIGQIAGVRALIERQQETGPALIVPVTSFAPEPYEVRRSIQMVIRPAEEGFTASFFDANLHASGDTEEEALRNVKALVLDTLENLAAEPAEQLGPQPARQLAVLRELVQKKAT